MRASLASLLWLLGLSAFAAGEGTVRLSVESGYDSNARRDFDQVDGGIVADGVMSVMGSAAGREAGEVGAASGSYDVGLRKFLFFPAEDVVAQSASGDAALYFHNVAVGVEGHGKDRRGGDRDYTDLLGDAYVEYQPDHTLSARVRGGVHRFIYWDDFAFSYFAPELGLLARYKLARRHSLFMEGSIGFRTYEAAASDPQGNYLPYLRNDTAITVTAGYSYRGPFTASFHYTFFEQASNSYGESMIRHRLMGTVGFRLPWQLYFLGEAALQYTVYPDGIFLSADTQLAQDDENSNTFSLKVVRPLSADVEAEARYGLYYNRLPQNGLTYWRQVAWVGLSWRL